MNFEEEIRVGNLSKEQLKFLLFKTIFENSDDINKSKWFDENSDNFKMLLSSENYYLMSSLYKGDFLKSLNDELLEYRKKYYDNISFYYFDILEKMRKLSLELGLKNSLELSNMYTYLLWNGYFSKDKTNVYSIENRKVIMGLLFADIMDGIGVCLNHADMLKDFLNNCGYDSAVLVNFASKNTKIDYKMDIERKVKKPSFSTKIMNFVLMPIISRIGNHAFTLIKENDRMYIYDSTNLGLLEIKDPYMASVINGEGIHKLHPYTSFLVGNGTSSEINALSGLFLNTNLNSPYDKDEFIFTCEDNISLFNNNISLLDDFYDDIKSSVTFISDITDKIEVKKKKRKK